MSGDDETSSIYPVKRSYGYGSTGVTEKEDPDDLVNVNERMIHCENDRYIDRIRQQSGLNNGPAMVNFQIPRSRRR